jgi:hypothetical protein
MRTSSLHQTGETHVDTSNDSDEAPWWAFPPVAAVALYAVNVAAFVTDVDPGWVALIGTGAAAALVGYAHLTVHEKRTPTLAFVGGTSAFAAIWSTIATAISPFPWATEGHEGSGWPLGLLAAGLAVAWPLYGALHAERRYELEEIVVHQELVAEEKRVEKRVVALEAETRYEHEMLEYFAAAKVTGLHLAEHIVTPGGYTLRLHITDDTSIDMIKGKLTRVEQIAARAYAARGEVLPKSAVTMELQKKAPAFEFLLHVREKDILGQTHPLAISYEPLSCLNPYDVGIYEDGTPILLDGSDKHEWLAGPTGNGKDGLLRVELEREMRMVDQLQWGCGDSKFWQTYGPWMKEWALGRAPKPPFDYLATTPAEIDMMFVLALKAIDGRSNIYRDDEVLAVSRDMPAIRWNITEAASVLAAGHKITVEHRNAKMTRSEILHEASRLGRSEQVKIRLSTQRGTGGEIGIKGTSTKPNIHNRFILGAVSPGEAQYLLESIAGLKLEHLEHPGNTFAFLNRQVRKMAGRVLRMEAGPVPAFAAAISDLRPDMDERTEHLLGDDYRERWTNPARIQYLLDYFEQAEGGRTRTFAVTDSVTPPRAADHDEPVAAPAQPPRETVKEPMNKADSGAFGAAPDLKAKFEEALRKRRAKESPESAKEAERPAPEPVKSTTSDDDFMAIVGQFEEELNKAPEFSAPREVPELLRKLLQEFGDREFVSTSDLAAAVGMDAATLGLTLSRPPFSIKRENEGVRRPEYEGKVTRGYFMTNLKAVAQEFLRGERAAE